jgi:hypothetical protein
MPNSLTSWSLIRGLVCVLGDDDVRSDFPRLGSFYE